MPSLPSRPSLEAATGPRYQGRAPSSGTRVAWSPHQRAHRWTASPKPPPVTRRSCKSSDPDFDTQAATPVSRFRKGRWGAGRGIPGAPPGSASACHTGIVQTGVASPGCWLRFGQPVSSASLAAHENHNGEAAGRQATHTALKSARLDQFDGGCSKPCPKLSSGYCNPAIADVY